VKKEEKVKYWIDSGEYDWRVTNHLFEKGDYPYALFFGHLTLEKTLKALYVKEFYDSPPLSHKLVYLSEKIKIILSQEHLELLEIATDFNLEARYPDEKFSFHKKCTKEFTQSNLEKIRGLKTWLLQQFQQ